MDADRGSKLQIPNTKCQTKGKIPVLKWKAVLNHGILKNERLNSQSQFVRL
jgi:hypothetical protein